MSTNQPAPPVIKISAYKAWITKEGQARPGCRPYDSDFYAEMQAIKAGKYADIIKQCREIEDKDQRDFFKCAHLPSLTISAVCKEWRKLENVIAHTGLLNIDIDAKSNTHITDWPSVRDQLFQFPNIVACFLSASGRGVTFVVRVHPDQHKDTFFSIVDGLKKQFRINADAALHDITRLRFVSYDPDCRIRYNFSEIPVARPSSDYLTNKKNHGSSEYILEPVGDADNEYNFLEAVKRAETTIEFKDGSKWVFLVSVAGSCNVMGLSLPFVEEMVEKHFLEKSGINKDRLLKPVRDIYRLYTNQHGTYNIEAAFERLNYKLKRHIIYDWLRKGKRPDKKDVIEIGKEHEADPVRINQIIDHVFSEYSEEFGYVDFPTIKKVQIWLGKRWSFSFNKVTGQPEMTELGGSAIETINPDELYRQLQISGFKFNLNNIKSLVKSAFVKPYDPIRDYFKSLDYDGKKDYIRELSGYVTTKEGDFWHDMFKKTLVRMIPCGLGIKENRIVNVLYQQKQETGKTSFIRFLNPFGDKYITESPIVGGNTKDTEIRFSENFLYNLEELQGLSRADVGKLKADISKAFIKERRPHAMFEVVSPRRCNFWASANLKEFLFDEENTRWLVFEVLNIDWSYKQHIDINKVWAQAWQLYKDGFDYQLSTEERQRREVLNDEYRFRRSEEELIARHFKPSTPELGRFYTSTEIAIFLNSLSTSLRVNPNNIGKTMKATYNLDSTVSWINKKASRGYWLTQTYNLADGETVKTYHSNNGQPGVYPSNPQDDGQTDLPF